MNEANQTAALDGIQLTYVPDYRAGARDAYVEVERFLESTLLDGEPPTGIDPAEFTKKQLCDYLLSSLRDRLTTLAPNFFEEVS